ncbi:MAG: Hsp70 family protein, partial [Hominilimicola sp.]
MAVQRYVGVDFGTSTSVIRVKRYKDGKPVEPRLDTKSVVFDAAGSVLVPSLIRTIGDNKPYYGYEAALGKKNSTLYQSFKIDLESDEEEKITLARKLTSDFLAYMGKQYNFQSEGGHFGEPNDEEHTIISYPVKWSEETKKFMLDAAKKAGFKNVEGMDEAHAAIHAVTMQNENYLKNKHYLIDGTPVNILLIDMGAGTTDLIVCRYTPGSSPKNEILCTWPKNGGLTFGGREVDEILRNYIKSMMSEEDADVILRKVGIDQFKAWKEMSVSPALTRNETVTEFSALDNILDILEIDIDDYSLDRAKFESFAKDYLEQFSRLINDCVNASGLNGGDIDLVITTGGHSQWYFVNDIIKSSVSLTKIKADSGRIVSVPRPHETVALGLVYSPISPQVEKPPRKKPEKMPEENNESEEQAVNDVDLVNNATEDEIAEVAMAELPNMPASKAYTLAKNSYKEGNYENAYKYFLTAALADNMYAQYRLSQLYATGLGCKKSQERAQTWLERSAKSGYSEAIRKLENNSYSGNTEKKTSESGISHTSNTLNVSVKYRKACAILREKDYGEAFDRFLYAAKENDAAAQYKLALMYLLNIAPREAYDDSTKKVFLRMFGQVAFDTRF